MGQFIVYYSATVENQISVTTKLFVFSFFLLEIKNTTFYYLHNLILFECYKSKAPFYVYKLLEKEFHIFKLASKEYM